MHSMRAVLSMMRSAGNRRGRWAATPALLTAASLSCSGRAANTLMCKKSCESDYMDAPL
jgi:hypothetical protein